MNLTQLITNWTVTFALATAFFIQIYERNQRRSFALSVNRVEVQHALAIDELRDRVLVLEKEITGYRTCYPISE